MTEQELQDLRKMVEATVETLDDIKADSTSALGMQDKISLFSRTTIISDDSSCRVKTLANNVAINLKEAGFEILSTEGQDSGEQALVDADDLVTHVVLLAVCNYHNIDTFWGDERPGFYAGA